MKELFEALRAALDRGEGAVLCTIVASSGSAPRGAGAKMAVFADGACRGTIGGGAVERKSQEYAQELLRSGGASLVHAFRLSPNEVQDIGMICGGNVTVAFQVLDAAALPVLDAIVEALTRCDEDVWLITPVQEGLSWSLGLYDASHGLRFADALSMEDLRPMLLSRGVLRKEAPSFYVEPLVRAGVVYLFGGGHVGRELCPLLAHVGFRVVLFDDRPQAALPQRFPQASRVILGDYRRIFDHITVTDRDYVVIMTPGHQSDFELLAQVLTTPAPYIGCIGSRRKAAAARERLAELGFPPAELDRVHSPIGLPIGGETPAEIAISIAAQLIAHRSGRL
ncbi:XdhC/CoxI family protein [uncultured Intestinimonas sp.]|uniref:XdhC family protein n=1 Tax=uncultured Intestinimonas sp. TaxID=1689265 RepID=UPI0025EA3CF1|nr:XdhC/CoxI family protein [uncultured Intestinimonas sp.]